MVGGLWLNALKMTVIPLIVALLVTGVAKGAEAARAGRIAGRSVLWIVIVCTSSAIFGDADDPVPAGLFPLPQAAAEAMHAGLAGIDQATARAGAGRQRFLPRGRPGNVIAAAANGDVLPLVVFSLLFALAAARIASRPALAGRPVRSASPTLCCWSSAGCCGSRPWACSRWPSRVGASAGGGGLRGAGPLYRADLGHRSGRDPGRLSAGDLAGGAASATSPGR